MVLDREEIRRIIHSGHEPPTPPERYHLWFYMDDEQIEAANEAWKPLFDDVEIMAGSASYGGHRQVVAGFLTEERATIFRLHFGGSLKPTFEPYQEP